ncbi:MAG TPA: hypothetical protein DEQ48_03855, partial [Helicobacter sp.]|nr:hypothetical protein [Helicobacter sp.]
VKNIEVLSEKVDEKKARIELRVNFKNGEDKMEHVKLTNIDGKWKIDL